MVLALTACAPEPEPVLVAGGSDGMASGTAPTGAGAGGQVEQAAPAVEQVRDPSAAAGTQARESGSVAGTPARDAREAREGNPAAAGGERAPTAQSEADEYTRYELLDPASSQFHILYEVTATTPGARLFFNPIRKGSEASGETVFDRASSRKLAFEVVTGAEARASGLADADDATSYIRVHLPRVVPAVGGVRLLIEKTYRDAKSYFQESGGRIVFSRSLGIRRNAVVLPAGYELIACNIPSQVLSEGDGRVAVSFMHTGPEAAPLLLRARRLAR